MRPLVLVFLAGCCAEPPPAFVELDPVYLGGQSVKFDLMDWVEPTKHDPEFALDAGSADVIAELDGTVLTLTPQPGWSGQTALDLAVTARCGGDEATLTVYGGDPPTTSTSLTGSCLTEIRYQPSGDPERVSVAGVFNDWDSEANPLTPDDDGSWFTRLDLPPGSYPYKLVEVTGGAFGDDLLWFCDPGAPLAQCDAGYIAPWETDWAHECSPGVESCNSLLVVRPCGPPELEVTAVDIDREGNRVSASVAVTRGEGGDIVDAVATLDGVPVEAWTGDGFEVSLDGLTDGRHTLRFVVTDAAGNNSEEAYIPFWTDDRDWRTGVMYFAFIDRLNNADPSLDFSEGATAVGGGYEGGDLAGLTALLPYLDDLGVTVLWISNAQDNSEGAWAGDCNQTYAGYHAYWPDDALGIEEHFGTEDDLKTLVDAAHDRGMRVIMDWVANHVHETHPYYAAHPEWFNPYEDCKAYVDGQINFDRIPETCWFASYLPDIDYSHPDALTTMVDDAMWWARTYELDGFRADAVKHMSHAVNWNLASEIERQIEHASVGGDEDFYTVGETFDSSFDRINAYVGPNQLDGQFDFPLYFAIRGAFIYDSGPLRDVVTAMDTSLGAWAGAPMSTFLGNHDVHRFVTDAAEGWQDSCDGSQIRVAQSPIDPWPTDRLKLAWTFLFTNPNIPLIYYGDELGLPGYPDPDNRQPLWWHTGGDLVGVDSVESMATRVGSNEASVLRHVQALAQARKSHPALYAGARTEWWGAYDWDLYAYARSSDGDHVLTVLNRGETAETLTNGLAFASLPTTGQYRDLLTGDVFVPNGDSLSVDVPARGSRVLIHE